MADADDALMEDHETDPTIEPKSSRAWLAAIEQAEKAFDDYQTRADNIDKVYADLSRLANTTRDREFQMFWANIEVLKPSVYSRPPVPVVVPKFKDRRRVPRKASEMLERCSISSFDMNDIDGVMRLVRDDVVLQARGVIWVRYETKAESDTETERLCYEHVDRKDFLHEPSRKWPEVGWVAKRSWLTKRQMRKRFKKTSGDAYLDASYIVRKEDKENGAADRKEKAGVWEVWSKTEDRVVWVCEGVRALLDDDKPHLKLEGFFPCPQPAYATTQRRSLIPVPDMLFYKDQLEEINELTGRISALTSAVRVRGFYPAGTGEIGEAIETAIKSLDDRQVMIGVSNWAAFGGSGSAKDTIVWLPIDMIVTTIAALIEQRRQIIDDVYQITGLSDIMRGATDPKETLGAQQLKSQYGSIRIRDRQAELVRIARDTARIGGEIMAENFKQETLLEMSQMELPTEADMKRRLKDLERQAMGLADQAEKQIKEAEANPQFQQMRQQEPEKAEQLLQQGKQQFDEQISALQAEAQKMKEETTIDEVMDLLRSQKLRPFVLDIETDSTIQPDEDAEKQRRAEFVTTLAGLLQQAVPMFQAVPESADFLGEVIKFGLAPYRAGREMEGAVDEFVDKMKAKAGQPQPNPEAEALKAQAEGEERQRQADMQMKQMELQARMQENDQKAQIEQQKAQAEIESKGIEAQQRQQENDAKLQQINAQMQRDQQKGALEMQKLTMELDAKREEIALKRESAQIDQATQVQQAQISMASAEQQAAIKAQQAAQRPANGAA